MKINDIISMVKDTTQKISEKKTLKIKDIVLIPEFQKLLVMEEDVLEKMKQSMKEEGFKSGNEIHIWKRGKEYILIDGHTRKCAWESLETRQSLVSSTTLRTLKKQRLLQLKSR